MSNVTKFEEMLKSDEALQAKLQELTEAYAGDKADEQAIFEATVGKLAAEAGLPFTLEEAREVVFSGRELGDDELEAVAGGSGVCYMIGGSNEAEAKCHNDAYIGHACAYVGVSF